jgi:hypothetical protein
MKTKFVKGSSDRQNAGLCFRQLRLCIVLLICFGSCRCGESAVPQRAIRVEWWSRNGVWPRQFTDTFAIETLTKPLSGRAFVNSSVDDVFLRGLRKIEDTISANLPLTREAIPVGGAFVKNLRETTVVIEGTPATVAYLLVTDVPLLARITTTMMWASGIGPIGRFNTLGARWILDSITIVHNEDMKRTIVTANIARQLANDTAFTQAE